MVSSPPEKDDLGARIAAAQAKQAAKYQPKAKTTAASGYGTGMKMVLDLVGGALVGLVFGLALDQIFGTKPWGVLILLLLGMASGFRLMLRTAESHAKRNAETLNAADERSDAVNKGQEKE
jgi:Uncharacterized protein conserved in bacteria|tara:strand:- start:149 stop:511 length:363 start_codon:yes stop_codon:yes gene_type:complete